MKNMGASADADPALVASDQAPSGLAPTGFDPLRFEYRFSIKEKRERHDWIVAGKLGAINIWAEPTTSSYRGEHWFGGIECHRAQPFEYNSGHHEHCWLLDAECWHDGSSLQFSEQVEHRLPPPSGRPIDGSLLDQLSPLLTSRYRTWLQEPASAIEARRAATGNTDAVADESAVPQGDAHE